jgi:Short C-terminal domain
MGNQDRHPVFNDEFPGVITFKLLLAALAIIGFVGWPWFLWQHQGHAIVWMVVGIIWDALVAGTGGLVAYMLLQERHVRRAWAGAPRNEVRDHKRPTFEQHGKIVGAQGVWQSPQPPERADAVEQIQRWAALRDRGLLTDEEFQHQKRKLLGM